LVLVHFFSIPAYDWAGLMYLKLLTLQVAQGLPKKGLLGEAGNYNRRPLLAQHLNHQCRTRTADFLAAVRQAIIAT
jgi:hypothetical protein